MVWILLATSAFGLNLVLWSTVGVARFVSERRQSARPRSEADDVSEQAIGIEDVAVLIPAHDEARVIERTIQHITRLVPAANVYVISDGSTDETAVLARRAGVEVLEIPDASGKADALKTGIEHFDLRFRYSAILLLDADTRLDDKYFEVALPWFDDVEVCAVAGCASTVWRPKETSPVGTLLAAYRDRTYFVFQRFVKYGQCWKYANVAPIVPGFASLYRTSVLDKISIDEPGLIIEDFNMTFEVHHRKLGLIAFDPRARAYTLDPHRLPDYRRQVRRWSLGFWQTVRRHGVWAGKFWASLALMITELLTSSVALVAALGAFIVLVAHDLLGSTIAHVGALQGITDGVSSHLSYRVLVIGILLPDYLLTCVTAVMERRPRYLFLGLFFIPLRIVDAIAVLGALPKAWFVESTGRWTSPERQAVPQPDPAPVLVGSAAQVSRSQPAPTTPVPVDAHPVSSVDLGPGSFSPVSATLFQVSRTEPSRAVAEPVVHNRLPVWAVAEPVVRNRLSDRAAAEPVDNYRLPDWAVAEPVVHNRLPNWAVAMFTARLLDTSSTADRHKSFVTALEVPSGHVHGPGPGRAMCGATRSGAARPAVAATVELPN
jgi:poly-beta-1,6-N-acetyl-D-glucosamine synthase